MGLIALASKLSFRAVQNKQRVFSWHLSANLILSSSLNQSRSIVHLSKGQMDRYLQNILNFLWDKLKSLERVMISRLLAGEFRCIDLRQLQTQRQRREYH